VQAAVGRENGGVRALALFMQLTGNARDRRLRYDPYVHLFTDPPEVGA